MIILILLIELFSVSKAWSCKPLDAKLAQHIESNSFNLQKKVELTLKPVGFAQGFLFGDDEGNLYHQVGKEVTVIDSDSLMVNQVVSNGNDLLITTRRGDVKSFSVSNGKILASPNFKSQKLKDQINRAVTFKGRLLVATKSGKIFSVDRKRK